MQPSLMALSAATRNLGRRFITRAAALPLISNESVDNYLVLLIQTTVYSVDANVILNEVKNLNNHTSRL